jgi:energy-converting hydrogenase A subunit M
MKASNDIDRYIKSYEKITMSADLIEEVKQSLLNGGVNLEEYTLLNDVFKSVENKLKILEEEAAAAILKQKQEAAAAAAILKQKQEAAAAILKQQKEAAAARKRMLVSLVSKIGLACVIIGSLAYALNKKTEVFSMCVNYLLKRFNFDSIRNR